MTRRMRTTARDEIGRLPAEQGFDGLADALRVPLHEVPELERAAVLKAGPHQRAAGRTGYADGYAPKAVRTRAGALTLAVPRAHRRRRASNVLERLNEELRRRTRVAGQSPDDAGVPRLVRAVRMEVSEDRGTNREGLTVGPA